MKKLIFMGILGLFILGSCNSKSGGNHEGHDHGTEAHDHDHEGENHNHEGEDHEGHDHEGEEHSQGTEPAAGHSDEIILPKVKAEAAGVKTSVIAPEAFEQVIKTSGQVLAAQEMNP